MVLWLVNRRCQDTFMVTWPFKFGTCYERPSICSRVCS